MVLGYGFYDNDISRQLYHKIINDYIVEIIIFILGIISFTGVPSRSV